MKSLKLKMLEFGVFQYNGAIVFCFSVLRQNVFNFEGCDTIYSKFLVDHSCCKNIIRSSCCNKTNSRFHMGLVSAPSYLFKYIHNIHTIYTKQTHNIHTIYTVCTQYTDNIHTIYTQYPHNIPTIYTQYTVNKHTIYTQYTQYTHNIQTIYTQYPHNIPTIYTQYTHNIYTINTQYTHNIHTHARVLQLQICNT